MNYGDAGEFLGAKITTDPTTTRDYCRARAPRQLTGRRSFRHGPSST